VGECLEIGHFRVIFKPKVTELFKSNTRITLKWVQFSGTLNATEINVYIEF